MKSIDDLKKDKEEMTDKVLKLLQEFEDKYGEGCLPDISFSRWNGSTSSSGRISKVRAHVVIY